VSRLSLATRRDPYWEMDGQAARRDRMKRRLVRYVTWVLVLAVVAVASLHLPAIDPEYLVYGEGRPVMAAALLGLLGSAAILALARIRHNAHE
jgi:hypothetical protein